MKGFGTKEGGADCDLALSVSLVLRDLIIMLGDFFRQIGDTLDILIFLGGKTQHKVEFYLIPAAGKGFAGTSQDILLGESLIDDVSHPLGTGLGSEGQAAFLDILHFAHDVQGKGVDTERRQGNIDALAFASAR